MAELSRVPVGMPPEFHFLFKNVRELKLSPKVADSLPALANLLSLFAGAVPKLLVDCDARFAIARMIAAIRDRWGKQLRAPALKVIRQLTGNDISDFGRSVSTIDECLGRLSHFAVIAQSASYWDALDAWQQDYSAAAIGLVETLRTIEDYLAAGETKEEKITYPTSPEAAPNDVAVPPKLSERLPFCKQNLERINSEFSAWLEEAVRANPDIKTTSTSVRNLFAEFSGYSPNSVKRLSACKAFEDYRSQHLSTSERATPHDMARLQDMNAQPPLEILVANEVETQRLAEIAELVKQQQADENQSSRKQPRR